MVESPKDPRPLEERYPEVFSITEAGKAMLRLMDIDPDNFRPAKEETPDATS